MKIKESKMSENVKTFLSRGRAHLKDERKRIKCTVVLREFKFRNCKFDVVGYNNQEKAFYIVECKRGSDPVSTGHAFGQVLVYSSLLRESGFEFKRNFIDELLRKSVKGMDATELMGLVKKPESTFRFYVALGERACKRYDLLKLMKSQMPNVGIIRVKENGECRLYVRNEENQKDHDLSESTLVSISFKKKYENRETFFKDMETRLKEELPESLKQFGTNSNTRNYKKFWYQSSSIHFETCFAKKCKEVEVGLHLESSPQKNERTLQFLLTRKKGIVEKIGKGIIIGPWYGKKTRWARASEKHDWEGSCRNLDEVLMNKLVERLETYIETLKPILDEFNKQTSDRSF